MRSRSVAVSIVVHAAALLAAVIVPLLATSDLPAIQRPMTAFIAAFRTAPVPAAPAAVATTPARRVNPIAAPLLVPDGIAPERPLPSAGHGPVADGGLEAHMTVGLPDAFGTRETDIAPPPPPPLPPEPVRVTPGGTIKPPRRIGDVAPVYPVVAQNAGVQGIVILEATIDRDGRVQNVRVLRSLALLDRAAIDAVSQWRYTPTLLNGVPVPVVMTVTVDFRLTR